MKPLLRLPGRKDSVAKIKPPRNAQDRVPRRNSRAERAANARFDFILPQYAQPPRRRLAIVLTVLMVVASFGYGYVFGLLAPAQRSLARR